MKEDTLAYLRLDLRFASGRRQPDTSGSGANGNFGYQGRLIQVGSRWAGARIRVIPIGELTHVYCGEMVIRTLTIDPDRYYQPLNGHRGPNGRCQTSPTSMKSVR